MSYSQLDSRRHRMCKCPRRLRWLIPAEAGLVHQRHLPQAPAMAELLASFDAEFRGTQQQGEAEALRAAQEAEAAEASKLCHALPTVSELQWLAVAEEYITRQRRTGPLSVRGSGRAVPEGGQRTFVRRA